ncbi:MAG TPA: uroporphyrinogen decarboxylase family protein [Victivallales bacterium]|nr:uroporphyrinogen decarboxylase family protein [Victivallales bacterium]
MSELKGYKVFSEHWQENARLALDTIAMKATKGIPTWMLNDMQWSHLDHFSGNPPGSYEKDPVRVYREFQLKAGACFIDQWIPENPLTMKDQGYGDGTKLGATTGAEEIVRDGMLIDSPEAVVEHMEKYLFPEWEKSSRNLEANANAEVSKRIAGEAEVQNLFGMNMIKGPYDGFFAFPNLQYGRYGYANYFMAYALYPEVMERSFKIRSDCAIILNRIAARAIVEGGLPRLIRLDHDMADSRGTLVDVKTLDRIWFPHFARAIRPFHEAGIRLIWHCDGNLMEMVPRLLEAGIGGFQGFQYEDGMDYEKICKMKTRDGSDLFIIGGVSVTTTLPLGKPEDVKKQLDWLVEKGPKVGLMLGGSSSIAPGVPVENIKTLIEGLAYYRKNGRKS